MKGKARALEFYNGKMRAVEEINMSEMLRQDHLNGYFLSDADAGPFCHHCRRVFATRFSLQQLKYKTLSFYRQQQEILQSYAPHDAPATQMIGPLVNECNDAIEQVGGPFSQFCRTYFPSKFSFRALKKKLLSVQQQQLQWQALPTATEENESPAPSGTKKRAAAQSSREKQAPPPANREQAGLLGLAHIADMGYACSQNNPPLPPQRLVVEEHANTETASEDATFQPHPFLLAEDLIYLPSSNHQSDAVQKDTVAGKPSNLHNWPVTIGEEFSPQSWQAHIRGGTMQVDNDRGGPRRDDEVSNIQVDPVLSKECNHRSATKWHSNTEEKAIVAVGVLNLKHHDAMLKLRRFPSALDTENNSGTEADCGSINLLLEQSWSTLEVTQLPQHLSHPGERAIVAVEKSKRPDPIQSIGNDSTLHPRQALQRIKETQLDNKSDIHNSIGFLMERPATKKAKHDTSSKSNCQSCKQATPSKASERMDDNFQLVRAFSGHVSVKNVETEEYDRAAYGHGQHAKSPHHVASVHRALSILQHADYRCQKQCKKRIADAQGVDIRHQIEMLRYSAMLDLEETRVTLSRIVFPPELELGFHNHLLKKLELGFHNHPE